MSARSPKYSPTPTMPHSRESLFSAPPSSCVMISCDTTHCPSLMMYIASAASPSRMISTFASKWTTSTASVRRDSWRSPMDEKKWFDLRNS